MEIISLMDLSDYSSLLILLSLVLIASLKLYKRCQRGFTATALMGSSNAAVSKGEERLVHLLEELISISSVDGKPQEPTLDLSDSP